MRKPRHRTSAFLGLLLGSSTVLSGEQIEFNRDIRPILSDHCFACHGFDAKTRKSKLRLDTSEGAFAKRKGLAAITPGDPVTSSVWHRITSNDPDEVMPPPEAHKVLEADEIALIKQWIEEGANYQAHWAFVPPKRNFVSESKTNPIDHFIRKKLSREGLKPSPPADKATLIRRVTLDLTGLPPTPEQVAAFLEDSSPEAYENLVDRLMATRDYAERRAQDWLDLARYADTRGFADDQQREIWPYRDWVVRALHHNMPFDQFTIEQLAGDLLPDATDEQKIATAFHRNAPQAKGQTYPVEEYRLKGVTDRVNTTGKVWLGLTMECAECHDHKFDPISQEDYFSLFALFNNIEHSGSGFQQGGPTMVHRFSPGQNDPIVASEMQRLRTELAEARQNLPARTAPGIEGLVKQWNAPQVETDHPDFNLTGDLSVIANINTTQAVANIVSKYDWKGKERAFVFGIGGEGEAEAPPGHLFFWASSRSDPFVGVTVYGSHPVNDGHDHEVSVSFSAGRSVRLFVDGIEDTSATVTGKVPATIALSKRNLALGAGYQDSEKAEAHRFEGSLNHVRLYRKALGDALGILDKGVRVAHLTAALRKLGTTHTARVPVMKELPKPRETFIHLRGGFLSPGKKVTPSIPSVLSKVGVAPVRNRLEFARWLVNGENPLVARVVVNRFWQSSFGHGLVRTPDDFGSQGSLPTHPELLDELACDFVESGWDMKHLHRLIVTSETYRQSARLSSQLAARDPQNLLLARMTRVRLPAEQLRDQALAVSGLLRPYPGGPPVFPPQPEGYWEERDLPGKWQPSMGDDRYRKSLYTYRRRMALHPTLALLDSPARSVCAVKRNTANLPTQALVTLNAPVFVESASQFALRLLNEESSSAEARLKRAFQLSLGRLPDETEKEQFLRFLGSRKAAFSNQQNPDEAAWRSVATVLLNLDETLTRP